RSNRIDADKVDCHSGQRGNDYDSVKELRLPDSLTEAIPSAARLANRIRAAPSKNRHGQEAGADQTHSQQKRCGAMCQWPQGLSSVGGGLDVRVAGLKQCGGRCEDYEIHDHIREEHSYVNIPSRILHLRVRSSAPLRASYAAKTDFFFDFLIGLPEKQIRRDRGAENCYQSCQKGRIETELRNERGL